MVNPDRLEGLRKTERSGRNGGSLKARTTLTGSSSVEERPCHLYVAGHSDMGVSLVQPLQATADNQANVIRNIAPNPGFSSDQALTGGSISKKSEELRISVKCAEVQGEADFLTDLLTGLVGLLECAPFVFSCILTVHYSPAL